MDGAGSRSSRHSLSNSQENENSIDQSSNTLSSMSQGPDLSTQFLSTAPQDVLSQSTNAVSLMVMPASGNSTGTPDNTTITHRIDNRLHFDVTVFGLPLQGCFIRIPLTRSVRRSAPAMDLCQYLNLSFELRGAETGKIREFACQRCKNKISRDLSILSRVDFTEKQDTIALKGGKARISFRFTCYPSHDDYGTGVSSDKEYIIQAVLKDELQADIARYEIPKRFKIARYANPPPERFGGSGCSPLLRDGVRQVSGSLGFTAPVLVTPPLDSNPLIFQSSAHCGVPGSNSFPLHPLNVAENPAPLVLPLALQEPYAHIYRYTPAVTNIGMGATGIHGSGAVGLPRNIINLETRDADIMVQSDHRPSELLENESEAVDQRHSHDLQCRPGIHNTLQFGASSSTMQHPLDVPNHTPFIGVVSNIWTRDREDRIQGVVDSTEETPRFIPPSQLHGRTDSTHPHEIGTAPAPIYNARVTSATCSVIPMIPSDSFSSSATTIFPSTEGSSNGGDHRLIRSSLQRGTPQEPNPYAEYVVPSKGPMSGGVEVTIVGTNFPHTLPLNVYFSTKLAFITRKTRETIRCFVPAASSPGTVDVRIVVEPLGSAPEIDCKMAKFTYEDERMTELMVHVKYIASQRNPALWETTMTSMQRAVEAAMEQASKDIDPDTSKVLQSLDYSQFEEIAIQILRPYSTYHDRRKAVSRPNEYGQTLAHLAVTLGYTRLLEQLISWEIDLSVRDATGATALHLAYLYDYPDCASLITRHGADQRICDEPGRKSYAMTWPDDSDASSYGVLEESSEIASDCTGSITDREETLGTEHVSIPNQLREKGGFDPRQADLFECRTTSLKLPDLDLNPHSRTTDPAETGAIEFQPPEASAQGSPNCQQTISSGSYSHTNAAKGSLEPSQNPNTFLDAPSGQETGTFDITVPPGAPRLQNEIPTSARIGGLDRTVDDTFLKEAVPAEGGSILHQIATLPTADMPSPHDQAYITQELEARSAKLVPQGFSRQMLLLSGTPNPALLVPPSALPPTVPTGQSPSTAPPAGAPPVQPPDPVGSFVHSLLGANQNDSPDTNPVNPAHEVPKLQPPESYEFREMTLGCRFVTTDQWLTTRVDISWTVSQIKLHILTKLLGARRDQLKGFNHPRESHTESRSSSHPSKGHEVKAISTSNQSSVAFAFYESSDLDSPDPRYQLPPSPVEREPSGINPEIPLLLSLTPSAPTAYQAHHASEIDHHLPRRGFCAATAPPVMTNLHMNKVNKEDLLDELLDRLEADAKEHVYKVADKYCLTRFLCGDILDDRMTLTECQLQPFELLEMQEKSRFLQIPRRVYLDTYWESPVEVRTHRGGELREIEGTKRLASTKREEKVQQELRRDFVAEFMSNPVDEVRKEPQSATVSIVLPWKNTPEARAREHEKKRRKLLQKIEREVTKRRKREIKEAATEKWEGRLAIIEGHRLNVWRNRDDDHPEESWDLRKAVGVTVPKQRKTPEFPPGSAVAAYAALKNSNTLNVIRVKERQKGDMEGEAEAKQPYHDLHIQFSIPLSSVDGARDPARTPSKMVTKLKKWLQKANKASGLRNLASFSELPFNSSNQPCELGTGTIEGVRSATLVLRLPDERSLENLSRIIHRSAGKYPLNQKPGCTGVLGEGELGQEAAYPGPMGPTTARAETKFHPYREWRERVLQIYLASRRHGSLTPSGWKEKSNTIAGICYLPRNMQEWQEKGEEAKGEKMLDEPENEPVSMTSDAEWEGWRRELELKEPIRPGSPGLKVTQEGNPWTPDRMQQSFVTESDERSRSDLEETRC